MVKQSKEVVTDKRFFWMTFATSVLLALISWTAPQRRMPLDYDGMIYRSTPLAAAWIVTVVASIWRCKRRGLWLLLSSPLVFYWPIWLFFNHFPPCYYAGNCE